MPLLYVDIIDGRTPAEIQELLDATTRPWSKPFRSRNATATRW